MFSKSLFKFTNNLNHSHKNDMSNALNILKKFELRNPVNSLVAWCLRTFGKNTIHVMKLFDILNMFDHYQIVEVLVALIDKHSEIIKKENNERLNFIFENIEIELYDPKYLLSIYKQNKINRSCDIERLKNIANFISILHTILISNLETTKVDFIKVELKSNFKGLTRNLELIFKNLKLIIKKSLF